MWSTVSDLTANRYLVNVFANPQWFAVDLTTTDFSTSRVSALPAAGVMAALTL
jgi:hypothetical protein